MIKDITLMLCAVFWFIFAVSVSSSRHIYIRYRADNLTVSRSGLSGISVWMLHKDITWRLYKILYHLPWRSFTYGNALQGKTSTKHFVMDRIWALSQRFCLLCTVLVTRIWLVLCVILGFRREVDKNCSLLVCYAASSGNSLPTFRNNISVPSLRIKNPRKEEKIWDR